MSPLLAAAAAASAHGREENPRLAEHAEGRGRRRQSSEMPRALRPPRLVSAARSAQALSRAEPSEVPPPASTPQPPPAQPAPRRGNLRRSRPAAASSLSLSPAGSRRASPDLKKRRRGLAWPRPQPPSPPTPPAPVSPRPSQLETVRACGAAGDPTAGRLSSSDRALTHPNPPPPTPALPLSPQQLPGAEPSLRPRDPRRTVGDPQLPATWKR